MAKNVTWHLDELSGFTLALRMVHLTSGATVNGDGADSMVEGANGIRTAVVAESLAGWFKAYADGVEPAEATGYVNMDEASPVVREDMVITDTGEVVPSVVTGFDSAALAQLIDQEFVIRQSLGPGGVLSVTSGMAYTDATARPLIVNDSKGAWPVLTGASITMSVFNTGRSYTFAGSVLTATGSLKQVKIQLSAADTAKLSVGDWTYGIKAVLSSGDPIDLVRPVHTLKVVAFP